MVAKVVKKISSESGFAGRQRALVFCMSRRIGQQIKEQLEKKNMRVWLVTEERKLLSELDDADAELIFIEINAPTNKTIDQIVVDVFSWMRNRARSINKLLNSPSQYLWERSRIILFKSDFEITSTSSIAGDVADTDDLVRQCSLLGNIQYAGLYSPLSFISKVRALIE